jgi:Kef-type K+ transport system membrane component KefB
MTPPRLIPSFLAVLTALLIPATALASSSSAATGGHDISQILVALAVVLLGAKLGGDLAGRVGQPPVLGELLFGVVLGNVALVGLSWFEGFSQLSALGILAELGVIILLFQIGLEADLNEMMRVGFSSFLVATLGVIGPFLLGWGVGVWFYPDAPIYMHIFLGAILTATSVGITARVLKDLGRLETDEARVILGAAVIDDILGLLILAVVSGIIRGVETGTHLSSVSVLWLIVKAILFLGGAILAGRFVYPWLFRIAGYLRVHGMLLISALAVCFLGSYAAAKVGLAPIVGAFAAGLVLDDAYFRDPHKHGRERIEELLEPLAFFLVPVFFVKMGMDVDLGALGTGSVIGFALVLTLAAAVGKQLSALGVVSGGKAQISRWIVGIGMIPRGEVGLIFASIGASLSVAGEAVVSPAIYSAVVIMVMLTTLVTPPLLTWSFRRHSV